MSSRTGNVIRALDLITEVQQAALERMQEGSIENPGAIAQDVAVGAIKYTILKISAGQDIIFDLAKSISFEGDSGPYLQYTHARICSVLDKAAAAGVEASVRLPPPEPYAIERVVYQFPEVVASALSDRAPHQLVTYLTELAGAFNTFYATERIADPNDQYAPYKVALTDAVRQTLRNGLFALGIKPLERM